MLGTNRMLLHDNNVFIVYDDDDNDNDEDYDGDDDNNNPFP